jgi:hypothetical protein
MIMRMGEMYIMRGCGKSPFAFYGSGVFVVG